MDLLRNLPIKLKLTLITMLTSGTALLLACIAFVIYELIVFRTDMASNLMSMAKMVGDNSVAALTFNDLAAAELTLKSLNADPTVVVGMLYDGDGKVFATYHRADTREDHISPPIAPDGIRYSRDYVELFRTIMLADEYAGTVYLKADLKVMVARVQRYIFMVVIIMVCASGVALLVSTKLQTLISTPLSHLAGIVKVVATRKDYTVRAEKQGEDEMGQLIKGFNEMLNQIQSQNQALQDARDHLEKRVAERTRELEEVHFKLLDASRRSGMAEIATNVLHNVGNILNSVNISASLVVDRVKKSKTASLAKVAGLLGEHTHDLGTFFTSDPKGRQLPAYLDQLVKFIAVEHESTVSELESLQANIDHIKKIVTMQQSYAQVSGVKEIVNLVDLVEESLRINLGSLKRHGIMIIREYKEVTLMNVEKHKIIQILVNLIRNAEIACNDSGRSDKQVILRVAHEDYHVSITVLDNGVGIPPENLTHIFSHGFTTRKDGHGFGLHSSALTAQEMGGNLIVHSAGRDQGAKFTLELPCPT